MPADQAATEKRWHFEVSAHVGVDSKTPLLHPIFCSRCASAAHTTVSGMSRRTSTTEPQFALGISASHDRSTVVSWIAPFARRARYPPVRARDFIARTARICVVRLQRQPSTHALWRCNAPNWRTEKVRVQQDTRCDLCRKTLIFMRPIGVAWALLRIASSALGRAISNENESEEGWG